MIYYNIMENQNNLNKFANGKIYRIVPMPAHEENEVYYGSTTKNLQVRFMEHKLGYLKWRVGEGCKYMCFDLFDKYGEDKCYIELVENYECESSVELTAREGYYMKNNPCINKRIEGRTAEEKKEIHRKYYDKEHYLNNKDVYSERFTKYYDKNKEKVLARNASYYNNNKTKILEQRREQMKKYVVKNPEQVKAQKQKWYLENKENVKQKTGATSKQRVTCECGATICYGRRPGHIKTKKHLKLMEEKSQCENNN